MYVGAYMRKTLNIAVYNIYFKHGNVYEISKVYEPQLLYFELFKVVKKCIIITYLGLEKNLFINLLNYLLRIFLNYYLDFKLINPV